MDNPSTVRDVQDAVSTWNEAVETTFLEVQEMEEPCAANHEYGMITVGVGELGLLPNGNILLGTTNVVVSDGTGMIESAVILLDEDNDPATSLAVSIHELGHAFGLRHDENMPMSVMYPLTWAPGLQQITTADSLAVRAQVPPFFERHDE